MKKDPDTHTTSTYLLASSISNWRRQVLMRTAHCVQNFIHCADDGVSLPYQLFYLAWAHTTDVKHIFLLSYVPAVVMLMLIN